VNLADLCIRRPVFATMLVGALIVLGLFSYDRLGVDLYPDTDFGIVTVTTTLRGASAEEIESTVSKTLEESLNTIDGVDSLRSVSKEGVSFIIIEFVLEKDGDVAAQAVRDRVSTAMARLPIGTDPPVIDKFDFDAAPILSLVISGEGSFREITEIARKRVKEELETVPGVGQVILVGGRDRAINVFVDPARLEAYGLSIAQVRSAIQAQNLETPGGRVERAGGEWNVRTMGRLGAVRDFGALVVATVNGEPVRLRDVGYAEDGEIDPRSLTRLNGEAAVQLLVKKQSGANTVDVVDRVKARMEAIRSSLPRGTRFELVRDQSRFIRLALHEVQLHLWIGALLVAVTTLAFMHDLRSTLIASVAIPASVIATFSAMYAFGFTINNLTMLALVLAVGIVIDDAVVVLENIFRHVEEDGTPPREAASTATREIALAVVATTVSLVIIFVPIAFMGGMVGRFFRSFGITVAVAIMVSLLVSFTLTPMLSSRFLRAKKRSHGTKEGFLFAPIDRLYGRILRASLRHRWVVVVASLAVFAATFPLGQMVGKNFLDHDDQSEFEIILQAPGGYTLDQVSNVLAEIEGQVRSLRGVTGVLTTIGDTTGRVRSGEGDVTAASVYVRLTDLHEREFTQFDVMADARTEVEFDVKGSSLAELGKLSSTIADRMKKIPGIVDVDTSLVSRVPELRVEIDRDRAAEFGVSVADVAQTLRVAVGGEAISRYREEDELYDVWLRAIPGRRRDARDVANLSVPGADGKLVRLANLVDIEPDLGPSQIERSNRRRKVTIFADLLAPLTLSTAIEKIQAVTDDVELPPGYSIEWTGRAKMMADAGSNFALAFGLSIIFMYMVLAAQFESFLHPVSIMLALPLTIPCALLSLVLLGEPIGVYSVFGIFMLFGIVKKNGILQIDYTNTLRAEGKPRDEAILEANHVRLRPILMTTVMLIAGMIPIALGQGPGAASRAGIAKVIIGGQAISLLITLLITPVAYSLFDDAIAWGVGERVRRFGRRLLGRAEPVRPGPRPVPAEIVRTGDAERKSA
jgi:hydrophobic/amphiphilic exporter-1 (mainly G- bacteria), HAE1 family